MKLWLIPIMVIALIALAAIAAVSLPLRWAFFLLASCIVIGLGAAPVVFAVYTRRVEAKSHHAGPEGDEGRP